MKKIFRAAKRRKLAFTLVELLIVLIIIGILAGAMLLQSASASYTAEATKIVNDLRTLKSAVLFYYAENPESPLPQIASVEKYLDKKIENPQDYLIEKSAATGYWYVGVTGNRIIGLAGTVNYEVKKILVKMAPRAQLLHSFPFAPFTNPSRGSVFMRVR